MDDRLPAEPPRRGVDLRQLRRPLTARREDRGPLPGRRVRHGPARGAQAGPRPLDGTSGGGSAGRGGRSRRAGAGCEPEGLGRERARALRGALLRDPGLRAREPARLAAADRHQLHFERRGLGLDHLPQGSDGRELAERSCARALPLDHGEVREGRERKGCPARLRDGGCLRDRAAAEGGGEDADARWRGRSDAEAERRVEPVPAARNRDQDDRHRPLPDRAVAAAALVAGKLEELRRPLGFARRARGGG